MLRITVVCCVLVVASAFHAIGPLEPKPEKFKNEEGCYMSELDKVIPFGESVPSIEACHEYACGQNQITVSGCGLAAAMPPFELVEDKDKPYPDCCPRLKDSTLISNE